MSRGRREALSLLALALGLAPAFAAGQGEARVATSTLQAEIDAFFDREVPAHLERIPVEGPLPDRVYGALTTGQFSWGTFVRALAAYAEIRRTRTVGGRDVVPLVARVGVLESAAGSKAFAQLYAALALRHFGVDLGQNPLWQSLGENERAAWRSLLDPTRFYDPATRRVISLPENYLGVASRVAGLAFQMSVLRDRGFADALLERAARPFARGALYADDAGSEGRFDRYSNEYARYVFEAAATLGRADVQAALRPSLQAQMKLWWDLVAPDGYGYPWGRSLGAIGYLDTLEIVAFLGLHPELRPAPLEDLAGAYHQAWRWLFRDYRPEAHLLSVLAPGRGNYSYISKEREWQQTVGFFGKALVAHDTLMRVLTAEGVRSFPATPRLASVARFEWFRTGPRPAGVWVVRQGDLRFALPLTSGTRPGVADYLPAPHGLPGFAAPVEQVYPAASTFFELADGRVLIATDGADLIAPATDGRSLRATWRRFALQGAKSGEWVEPGFEVAIEWRIEGATLYRTETLLSTRDVRLRRLWWVLPSTPEAPLAARASGDLALSSSTRQHGDEPLGRGARGPIPTHIQYEARDLQLRAGVPVQWEVALAASGNPQRTTR